MTYGILRLFQLSGGGGGGALFCSDPENEVTVNELIRNLVPIMVWILQVNMQNLKYWLFYFYRYGVT